MGEVDVPEDETIATSVRLPLSLLSRIDRIAGRLEGTLPGSRISRNAMIQQLLTSSCDAYEREDAA